MLTQRGESCPRTAPRVLAEPRLSRPSAPRPRGGPVRGHPLAAGYAVNTTARCFVQALFRRLSRRPHRYGRKLLRKRMIASGGSQPSVGKSLRERQRSPQVGRDPESCGYHRQVAAEPGPPTRQPRWGGDVISPAFSRESGAVGSGRIGSPRDSMKADQKVRTIPS